MIDELDRLFVIMVQLLIPVRYVPDARPFRTKCRVASSILVRSDPVRST